MPETEAVTVESGATAPKAQSWQEFSKKVGLAPEKSEVKQEKPEKEAESGTADTPKEEKPEAKAESAAKSGVAQKQETKKDKPSESDRIAELTAQVKTLLKRAKEAEERIGQAEKPQSASKSEAKPEPPKRPNPFKWEGTPEEYEAALDKYEAHLRQEAVTQAEQARQQAQAVQQFTSKVEETQKRYPEFAKVADETAAALLEAPKEIQNWIQRSPMAFDLIYTIGEKPEALQDFMDTAKKDPLAAIRKLAFLEIEIGKELNKPKETETTEAEETPAKEKPRTPKPPSEVGGRGVTPEDVALSAVQAKDFRRAEAEWTRRRLARKGA